jgi:hypothetical protein
MALMKCPECGKEISSKSESCPFCGLTSPASQTEEKVIAEYKYRMTAAAPLWFVVFCGLIFFYGIGLICLLVWFILKTPAPALTITNHAVIYKTHKTIKIQMSDIEKIEARSSLPQCFIDTGYVIIYRNGWLNFPLIINGLPNPQKIQQIILDQKRLHI